MKHSLIRNLAAAALMLSLVVVVLGAYTRLTQAGLGCPDWPGCYGHMVMKSESVAFDGAAVTKAWTEMVHRYVAGTLAGLILLLALLGAGRKTAPSPAGRERDGERDLDSNPLPNPLPLSRERGLIRWLLLLLIVFQAALGMWTVTLKLLPIVVMGHLLGGLTIVGCLAWLNCQLRNPHIPKWQGTNIQKWALFAAIIAFIQIALGGWVSANYAGIACVGFPTCNGQWWPTLDFSNAFQLSPIGENYQGGLLDIGSRITIQFVHRLGAMLTAFVVLILAYRLYGRQLRMSAAVIAGLVLTQFCLGVANVMWLLPLPIAVLHNGVAALLLASLIAVNFQLGTRS